MSVLKFSYHNLRSSLKSCFSYCAVFPKDFVIKKGFLIDLWMAQGYIEPLNGCQSLEDAADEHFKILLRRCFFQDVKRDEYDEIVSVKIHDLMHDVAQEVAGGEFQVLSLVDKTLGDRTRHVTIIDEKSFESSSNMSNIRTFLTLDNFLWPHNIDKILKDTEVGIWKSLRVLELKHLIKGISLKSIGELQHLRYLDLSHRDFEELPNSITKLHNLQTLILDNCHKLRQLPHDFSKLVKLSHLNLNNCFGLSGMPFGLDKLTGLRLLTYFVVGGKKNITGKQSDDELKDLRALTNLTGRIWIKIGDNYRNVEMMKHMQEGYLSKIPGLKDVDFTFSEKCVEAEAEAALEKLQPHPNLKNLGLNRYGGRTIPWWRRAKDNSPTINNHLPNLVYITIFRSNNLVNLPSFSKLPFLKSLVLYRLYNLEYMETRSSLAAEATDTTFFPSLETLKIRECVKLRGWFREERLGDADYVCRGILPFPCLSTLNITMCPELTSFPPCPSVKSMQLKSLNKTSRLMKKMMGKEEEEQQQEQGGGGGDLNVGDHTSSSSCLATLQIRLDFNLESLSEYEKVFEICASSLRTLRIEDCHNLSRLSRGLEHLTALENLSITGEYDDNEEIEIWKSLHQSLHCLTFDGLKSMTSLPKGMQCLTSLQTLKLLHCSKLKGLPEWISCLSSLQSLTICYCDAMESLPEGIQTLTSLQTLTIFCSPDGLLIERCREPHGQDWPKIQHIPNRRINPVFQGSFPL